MEFFDNIVMLVGVLLIVVGLVMFAIGKKESTNQNNVEGFGIKVNVSNPSIILVVLGIGLLLVPRILPSNGVSGENQEEPIVGLSKPEHLTDAIELNGNEDGNAEFNNTEDTFRDSQFAGEQASEQPQFIDSTPAVPPSTIYFPSGLWELDDYSENGVDLSSNVNGSIRFSRRSSREYDWLTDFMIIDGWGNMARYQYQGTTSYQNGGYYIAILTSTDPSFTGQQTVPLELRLEDGERLHMRYRINNMDILIHWLPSS
ncbi:hypothetical protein DXX93_13215 [Thalassotalea euphylliae]|uniref:Uncharacterized protein n=1 Tax=Thalassotalea euphylliae TaxID=1655234 RepID=A0A3E0TSG5_9GAMM|nr:hypothetical protein [Thalassotalea euphylliae]REL27429.1 hypothetical protein DXX93_13215 [Thalassotalea euphylliae]